MEAMGNWFNKILLRMEEENYAVKVNSNDGENFQLILGDKTYNVEKFLSNKVSHLMLTKFWSIWNLKQKKKC
ncbi:MAG: hypothetical protein CM15mP98_05400 [Paracoccaceae bacterium]|nr:MAG: hypothetical protein CM15mP98_05400 [Paracoccaceae bacterium]